MNGNANDASGNGNDGTPMGITPTSDRFFQNNSAYYFSNTPSSIDCGNDSSFNFNDCTISAWVRPGNLGLLQQTILAKADSANTGSFALMIADNNHLRSVFYYDSSEARLDCFDPIYPSVWHNFVVTHSATYGVNMYIDGALCVSTAFTGNLRQGVSSHHLRIGSRGPSMALPLLNAKMDDVALWNVALGTEEIEVIYAGGLVAHEPAQPMSRYTFSPNPAVEAIVLDVQADLIGEQLAISNVLGQTVLHVAISDRSMHVPLSGLRSGLYFVQVGPTLPCTKLVIR
jgi:Concanavalin A-like lectin/glucanases superfamily